MTRKKFASIAVHFSTLEDPRVSRTQRHPLINVVAIGLCAVICGARHFTEMEEFGQNKREWLAKFLDLKNGIPSHDTFGRVFRFINPQAFQERFLGWVRGLGQPTPGGVVATSTCFSLGTSAASSLSLARGLSLTFHSWKPLSLTLTS